MITKCNNCEQTTTFTSFTIFQGRYYQKRNFPRIKTLLKCSHCESEDIEAEYEEGVCTNLGTFSMMSRTQKEQHLRLRSLNHSIKEKPHNDKMNL